MKEVMSGGVSQRRSSVRVVFHEGGHLSGGVSQRRSSVRLVFHEGGHLSGWCFMKEVICQGGIS